MQWLKWSARSGGSLPLPFPSPSLPLSPPFHPLLFPPFSNSSLIVRKSHKESLLVTSSSILIGLLLYYDAVLPVSLKRPVMIAVKFYCNQSTGGEGAELSCGGAKY